jgi:uncharacterized protein (TIGR04255 family)
MVTVRHLANAPIEEGLLDVRFAVPDEFDLATMETLIQRFSSEFPTKQVQRLQQAKFSFGAQQSGIVIEGPSPQIQRYVISDAASDGEKPKRVVQFDRDGFAVSRLRPYGDWVEVEALAKSIFKEFVAFTGATAVIRLATRFINVINIPTGKFDLDDYFTMGPRLCDGVDQTIFDFNNRVGVVDSPSGAKAWVNFYTRQESLVSQTRVAVLDIDAFYSDNRYAPTFEAVQDDFEKLHKLKNELFFGALTEKALESYL